MQTDIQQITRAVEETSRYLQVLTTEIEKIMVGQHYLIERLLIGILANGHILVEGVPGLAKDARRIGDGLRVRVEPDLLGKGMTMRAIERGAIERRRRRPVARVIHAYRKFKGAVAPSVASRRGACDRR